MPLITLNNGVKVPVLGLGTWKMSNTEAERSVTEALEIGYRHFDTATLYANESGVGRAIRGSGIDREEIFVTTKLLPTDFFSPEKAFEKSLSELDLEYVDLYLVHWPIPLMPQSVWTAMEKIYESKKARAIGTSNYHIGDIEKLLEYATVIPAVNQIKFSPFDLEEEVMYSCRSHGITVEAYSPLTRGAQLHDKTVEAIAKKYSRTPAQIMLRWALDRETIVIPKATSTAHMKENANIFDFTLAPEDITTLDALS